VAKEKQNFTFWKIILSLILFITVVLGLAKGKDVKRTVTMERKEDNIFTFLDESEGCETLIKCKSRAKHDHKKLHMI
jgi:uncharacterized membrane protein